jgi:hypothetical protein
MPEKLSSENPLAYVHDGTLKDMKAAGSLNDAFPLVLIFEILPFTRQGRNALL